MEAYSWKPKEWMKMQTKILLQKPPIWAEGLLLYYSSANQMGLFQKGSCASSTASSRSNRPSSLPHLNPIVILFEGYTSSKVQCLTSVSYKSSFWYPHLDTSVLSAYLKLLKAPLTCMQGC
jgi:hypothetical protein